MERTFELGRLVITKNAYEKLCADDIGRSLLRHAKCDWGLVSPKDREINDRAIDANARILSIYRDSHGVRFWIITEADRSSTAVLLPEDY